MAKLLKSEETKSAVGPVLLLSQLLLSELPMPSKARYPPIPPSSSLKVSSVFVQLGVIEHLRLRLTEAADYMKSGSGGVSHGGHSSPLLSFSCCTHTMTNFN